MLVSNNSLLNILLPNDNKALKDVLKEADTKTLKDVLNNKSGSINNVLKNLFDELKNGTKTKSNIESLLKNSNLFKDLGSFSKSLSTVLTQVESEPKLAKFKPLLESFLKDIKNLDEKSLKEQLSKSGVFLESKIKENTNTTKTALPSNIIKLLSQIQESIKNINAPIAKQISDEITKVINTPQNNAGELLKDIKSLVSKLQVLSTALSNPQTKNLENLTNQLKSFINDAALVESKIENQKAPNKQITQNTKEAASNINENKANIENKTQINTQTKELLSQIKIEVLQNSPKLDSKTLLNQIDNLLKSNDLFSKNEKTIEPKNLLNNLLGSKEIQEAVKQNPKISNLVLNLKNISNEIVNLEQKVQNSQNVVQEKASLTLSLKENISLLKNELLNIKNIDTKAISPILQKLESIQNIFSKVETPILNTNQNTQVSPSFQNNTSSFANNFTSNLNSLFLSLKENITSLSTNQNNTNIQNQVLKAVDQIETAIKENIINHTQNLNNAQVANKNESPISNDMKTVLLQMQDELASKTDVKSQDILKQVDKMLMQIDYHQLLSLSSNSNYVYVPFFWDMLEDGSISMKKTDEEKFYCQINLTLKDFGKVDLMLALYDKNKLDLTIHAQRDHFKEAVQKNLQNLKKNLNNVNLIPVNIKLLDLKEEENEIVKKTKAYENPYDQSLNSGIDIRV